MEGSVNLERMIRYSPVPALVVDTDYEIRDANEAWAQAVGADDVEAVCGVSALQFVPQGEREESVARLETVLSERRPVEQREYLFQCLDGEPRYAEGTIIPARLDTGEPVAHILLEELTESKAIVRESERRREQIERLHEVGIELAAADSREQVFDLTLTALEDIIAFDMSIVHVARDGYFRVVGATGFDDDDGYHEPPIDSEAAGLMRRTYRESESFLLADVTDFPEANPQDEYRSAISAPIEGIGTIQAVSFEPGAFDQTDLELVKLLSRHVGQALGRLEREQELHERQRELKLLGQIFSRVFRHNIRNELTVIQGHTGVIHTTTENESVADRAQTVLTAADALLGHTEKVREIETILEQQHKQQTSSLERLVAAALDGWERAESGLNIACDVADVEVSTVIGIEKAIQNAVENAIEHNTPPVTVEVWSKTDDETATVVIEDDGGGIPDVEREVLSSEQETSLAHGSGVGLWLMKWLVEKSGGDLTLENTDEGGRVELTFPRP